ncbi:hypothetical protein AKJ16_DCAP27256, partial [Drosera capensis]
MTGCDSNAVVGPIEESGSAIKTSSLPEDGSGEANVSVEMTEKSDKITGDDSVDFHVLKVPEDLPLREELENLGEFKDHEPIKLCISSNLDASQAIELQFREDDAMVQRLSAVQYKEPGESTVGPKDEFANDVPLLEYTEVDDGLKPIVEGLPAALSSQESERKEDEASNMSQTCESTPQAAMPRGAELVSDNIGVHSVREHDGNEDDESDEAIEAANSNVGVDAWKVNLAVPISSESFDATEAQVNHTSNVIGHGDEHHYKNPSAANVDSSRQEMEVGEVERSDASLAGNSSELALVSSVSHNETYIQQELVAITESIPLMQTISLREDGDDAHECENAGARILGSNSQELKSGEEELLDEINTRKLPVPAVTTPAISESHDEGDEVIGVKSHQTHIASENFSNHTLSNVLEIPSHPKDLVGTQDGVENVYSSDGKVVGTENVSPFDTSYVPHGGINVLGDATPISSSCAGLDSTPGTTGNHGEDVLGDGVGILQSATVEGSCAKESSHHVSGVPNKSLQADIDDDDATPISSSCAGLDSTPGTTGNHGEDVLGDGVGILQSATVEGSCAKESSHHVSGVPNKSLQADIDDDDATPISSSCAGLDSTPGTTELVAITESIPLMQTISLREDGDDAHECENAGARILGSNSQELKSGEEELLDEINTRKLPVPAVTTPAISESHDEGDEVIGVKSHQTHIASENFSNHTLSNVLEIPSHPKDLVGTQDGVENVYSSDGKVVGTENVSPFDTSYVPHGGINVLGDATPISSSCAGLDSTPGTTGNHGEDVLGDGVGILQSATVEGSCAKESSHDVSDVPNKSLQADIDDDGVAPAIDTLVDCSSQTDSLEAIWGSISDMEAILSGDSRATTEKQAGSLEPSMPVVQQIDKPETLDPPSFMKLVEPTIRGVRSEEASEIQTSKTPANDGSLQGGWFPSVSYGMSESPGRKRNEEIIAKVTNWSTSKQQHTALKSLLGEAHNSSKENPPSPKERDAIPAMKTG